MKRTTEWSRTQLDVIHWVRLHSLSLMFVTCSFFPISARKYWSLLWISPQCLKCNFPQKFWGIRTLTRQSRSPKGKKLKIPKLLRKKWFSSNSLSHSEIQWKPKCFKSRSAENSMKIMLTCRSKFFFVELRKLQNEAKSSYFLWLKNFTRWLARISINLLPTHFKNSRTILRADLCTLFMSVHLNGMMVAENLSHFQFITACSANKSAVNKGR